MNVMVFYIIKFFSVVRKTVLGVEAHAQNIPLAYRDHRKLAAHFSRIFMNLKFLKYILYIIFIIILLLLL